MTLSETTAPAVVRELRVCRTMLIRLILSQLKPGSPLANEAHVMIASIDRLAEEITGKAEYFWIGGSAPSGSSEENERWRKWETGE